jgi:hypothetical protein
MEISVRRPGKVGQSRQSARPIRPMVGYGRMVQLNADSNSGLSDHCHIVGSPRAS